MVAESLAPLVLCLRLRKRCLRASPTVAPLAAVTPAVAAVTVEEEGMDTSGRMGMMGAEDRGISGACTGRKPEEAEVEKGVEGEGAGCCCWLGGYGC